MSSERKIVLYIATSVDGFIAKENGDINWLHEVESQGEGDSGYEEFYNNIDTVLIGKKTYDQIFSLVDEFPYVGKKCYVFSRSKIGKDDYVEYVNGDLFSFTKKIKAEEGKDIWLVGGGELFNSFLKENLVDEIIITVIPIILGKGIPLFNNDNSGYNLTLKKTTAYGEFVQLHYIINR